MPNSTHQRLRGQLAGLEYTFDIKIGEYRIGSSPANHIRLSASGVSRQHALLTVTESGLVLKDRGSKNGTFVNGRRIEKAYLPIDAKIGFGPVLLHLEEVETPKHP